MALSLLPACLPACLTSCLALADRDCHWPMGCCCSCPPRSCSSANLTAAGRDELLSTSRPFLAIRGRLAPPFLLPSFLFLSGSVATSRSKGTASHGSQPSRPLAPIHPYTSRFKLAPGAGRAVIFGVVICNLPGTETSCHDPWLGLEVPRHGQALRCWWSEEGTPQVSEREPCQRR